MEQILLRAGLLSERLERIGRDLKLTEVYFEQIAVKITQMEMNLEHISCIHDCLNEKLSLSNKKHFETLSRSHGDSKHGE